MYIVQNVVPREFGHRDKNFRTIAIDKILIIIYNVYKMISLLISIQKNAAGLNRAEVLTVLPALVLLHHVFYKNSKGLALIKVRPFLLICVCH